MNIENGHWEIVSQPGGDPGGPRPSLKYHNCSLSMHPLSAEEWAVGVKWEEGNAQAGVEEEGLLAAPSSLMRFSSRAEVL